MLLGGEATPLAGPPEVTVTGTGAGTGAGIVPDAHHANSMLAYEMIGAVSSQLRDVAG